MSFKELVSNNSLIKKLDANLNELSSSFGNTKQSKTLIIVSIMSIISTLIVLLLIFYNTAKHNTLTQSLADLKLISQVVPRQIVEASSTGSDQAFNDLQQSQTEFNQNLEILQKASETTGNMADIEQNWKNISANIEMVTQNKNALRDLRKVTIEMDKVIPGFQFLYNQLINEMIKRGLPASQIAIAKDQVVLAEHMIRALHDITDASQNQSQDAKKVDNADIFRQDIETFRNYLNAQIDGESVFGVEKISNEELRNSLIDIREKYVADLEKSTSVVLNHATTFNKVQTSSILVVENSGGLLKQLNNVSISSIFSVYLPRILLVLGFATFLFCLGKLFRLRGQSDAMRIRELKEEYDRNQGAILQLLDEIADLADGDLRTYATVSENFTGAIADSINFAIDQLRSLVSRINETSQEVSQYSQNTQGVAHNLTEAVKQQSDEISSASNAIRKIAVSIDEVSNNATESTEVAKKSVAIASSGAEVVNRSMQGMDTIREQIQETSKRIKRLGESSQEIGNIVSLINDIADQTNILALNAAIQASMAGEAGRGFAVVADEVQRLAERSTSATKQIEGLVRTIQSDTNEAVTSMEHTTSEVIRGANLTKDAGVALVEIQNVSNTLAQLIDNISSAAQLQSTSVNQIANTMSIVQNITVKTNSATYDTAKSVSELANMAESLRVSVTDFKLPEKV